MLPLVEQFDLEYVIDFCPFLVMNLQRSFKWSAILYIFIPTYTKTAFILTPSILYFLKRLVETNQSTGTAQFVRLSVQRL